MVWITWQERLRVADSAENIIAVAKDFIAQLDPYELRTLPEPCRPARRFVDADDISSLADELARHSCRNGSEQAELVARLSQFFSSAASRLAEMTSRRDGDADDKRRLA